MAVAKFIPIGSFSQDPIGFAAGDANLYRYVGNGPVDSTDPSGLEEPGFEWHHDHAKDVLSSLGFVESDGTTSTRVTGGSFNIHSKEYGTMLPTAEHRLKSGNGIHCNDANGSNYDKYYRQQVLSRQNDDGTISVEKLEEARQEARKKFEDQYSKGHKPAADWPEDRQRAWNNSQRAKLGLPPLSSEKLGSVGRLAKQVDSLGRTGSKCILPVNIAASITGPLKEIRDDMKFLRDIGKSPTWGDWFKSWWQHSAEDPEWAAPGYLNPHHPPNLHPNGGIRS